MANLNLRDVPDELAHELKVEAAQERVGLRDYCVAVLQGRHYGVAALGDKKIRGSKKIANVSVGGEAQYGGTPETALPRGGKAQDTRIGVDYDPHDPPISILEKAISNYPADCSKAQDSLVEPIEGWNICGICESVHVAGEYFNHNFVSKKPVTRKKFPEWSETRLREIAAAEDEALSATGGLLAISPELYAEMEALHGTGRSGKAAQEVENGSVSAHPNEGQFGAGKASDGVQEPSVGQRVPVRRDDSDIQPAPARDVDMAALRDICAGKMPLVGKDVVGSVLGINLIEDESATEVDLCGYKSFNEVDGEWYMCCKEKHPYPKVKHGEWIKV